jgi:type II secretory pathway pseudopilin PulG
MISRHLLPRFVVSFDVSFVDKACVKAHDKGGQRSARRTCASADKADGTNGRCKIAAFTLIELLLVTAILGLVIAAIAACLGGGLRAWDAAHRFNVVEADAMTALRIFQKDAANAMLIFDVGCKGTEAEVTFPIVGVDPATLGTEQGAEQSRRILAVRYALEQGTLLREVRALTPGEDVPAPPSKEKLVSGLAGLRLDYRGTTAPGPSGGQWASGWASATNLPAAIRLSLDVPGSGAFTRTVVLPVAGP